MVVAYNHYARGARWLTWSNIPGSLSEAAALDSESWTRLYDYLDGNYTSGLSILKKRNNVPFSALTVWYLPGLDHQAHFESMSAYKDYFISTTDNHIKSFVAKLKGLGEFNNKIFIIVADHGHTAMPYGDVTLYEGTEDEKLVTSDTSCKLAVDGFNTSEVQEPELANNNLHIWELGNLFSQVASLQGASIRVNYKILVPTEIEAVFKDKEIPDAGFPTADKNNADVIAALNGPMAHIYIKGTDWSTQPENNKVMELAEVFRVMLNDYYPTEAVTQHRLFEDEDDYRDFRVDNAGRLRKSIDKILIRLADGKYHVFNGIGVVPSSTSSLAEPDYIKSALRIDGLNDLNRSSDIILIMKDKTSGVEIERYTTGVACKAWHGSLNPSDSYVPMIVAYPGGTKSTLETLLKRDTICGSGYSKCNGNWKLTDIVKELISEQYK